jgi:hypothetical protein
LGPLGTAATNRPIVPSPGDYEDEEIGGIIRFYRVLTMVYNTQNYWVFGLRPSSGF